MTNDRRLALVLSASLGLGAAACGGSSSSGPLNNASVVTDTVTLTDSMYKDSSWNVLVGDGPFAIFAARVATIPAPAITQAIADNGLVLVYINTDTSADSAAVWTPLPYTIGLNYLETFTYAYEAGEIKIGLYVSETDVDIGASNVYFLTIPTATFKVVVASGSAGGLLANRHGSG
jgi:hypothetical protein